MTLSGYIKNGQVVIQPPTELPEGAAVTIQIIPTPAPIAPSEQTLGQRLLRHAGKARGLPRDASRNHDHYLYGTPRK